MPTQAHSQRSAPPRRHVHSSCRSPHLRTPPHLPPTPQPHPPLLPSAAPLPARSAPPPGGPCRFAAPAPAAPAAMNPAGRQDAGPSWLPPWGVRPPASPSPVIAGQLSAVVASAGLSHHSRRLRHQRTASQAAALTASSPTSQGQLLCTMATIHLSPIAIRSRPTPHRSRLPGKERLESLIITISSKTANWVLVTPRPTHRRTSLSLPSALSSLSSSRDAPVTAVCACSVRSAVVVVVSTSASRARSL